MGSDFLHYIVLGISHKKTPIEIREQAFLSEIKKIQALEILSQKGLDSVILSTCNRCEIYTACEDLDSGINILKDFFLNFFDISLIEQYLFIKKDISAINHLYKVCAGLDSMVIGEDQILGQVKDSMQNSMQLGMSNKFLNKIFREAITTAKEIKSSLKISENPLSLSYIAIKNLNAMLKDLSDKRVVVVGTGKMGILAIKHLISYNVKDIFCCNRSYDKVKELMKSYPFLHYFDYEKRYELIKDADILITSTSSPHTIIKYADMPKLNKKLYAIDLSLPRDIDSNIKNMKNVELLDIDSLNMVSKNNEKMRENLKEKAQILINSSIDELMQWLNTEKSDSTIASLNQRCDTIQKDTMSYINRKLNLNSHDKRIIEKMLSSALKRVIKPTITRLKQIDENDKQQEYIDILNELFDLGS